MKAFHCPAFSIIFWAIDYNDSSEVQFALRTRWEKKLRMKNKKKFTLDEMIMEYKLFNEQTIKLSSLAIT